MDIYVISSKTQEQFQKREVGKNVKIQRKEWHILGHFFFQPNNCHLQKISYVNLQVSIMISQLLAMPNRRRSEKSHRTQQ